jgi:hypothetical protein
VAVAKRRVCSRFDGSDTGDTGCFGFSLSSAQRDSPWLLSAKLTDDVCFGVERVFARSMFFRQAENKHFSSISFYSVLNKVLAVAKRLISQWFQCMNSSMIMAVTLSSLRHLWCRGGGKPSAMERYAKTSKLAHPVR